MEGGRVGTQGLGGAGVGGAGVGGGKWVKQNV